MFLFLRSLLWTLLCPGTFAFLLPWYILSGFALNESGWGLRQYLGFVVVLTGTTILLWCVYAFARYGRGTLSPLDPARHFVYRGLYRYVRNPMYVGVLTILLGEALFFSSWTMLGYTAVVFAAFNLFIRLHEEPYLRKQFGEEYARYCEQVGRWIPGK